jgi:hypothetical protein
VLYPATRCFVDGQGIANVAWGGRLRLLVADKIGSGVSQPAHRFADVKGTAGAIHKRVVEEGILHNELLPDADESDSMVVDIEIPLAQDAGLESEFVVERHECRRAVEAGHAALVLEEATVTVVNR